METATWIIAVASIVNVLVLAAYAWYTLGILKASRRSQQATENLARLSNEALKYQIVTTYLEEKRAVPIPVGSRTAQFEAGVLRAEATMDLLKKIFPDAWAAIEQAERKGLGQTTQVGKPEQ